MRARLGLVVALAWMAVPASAQRAVQARVAMSHAEAGMRDSARAGIPARLHAAIDGMPLWSAPLASAVLPGLGQFRLRKDRFIAFAAVEAFLVLQYLKNNGEAEGSADNYRAIARDVSRRTFPGTHPDTIFEYYEAMSKHEKSGVFSRSLSGPTLPETNPDTYNGKQWILAREQFGVPLDDDQGPVSPNYAEALAYYESRAIPQAYGWTWQGAKLEQDLFRREITKSNDAYVRVRRNLSALIANHLLSSIDAFASVRLIQAAGGETRLSASIPFR